jgi:hypothetical protein
MVDLRQMLNALDAEVREKHGELKALDQRIVAARANLAELQERVGDHMRNLEVKKQLEKLQAAALKFADDLDAKGY